MDQPKDLTVNIFEIIDKKRERLPHTQEELAFLVAGVMDGTIPDYQLAAWLMAVCCNGLSIEETTWLTDLYVRSGQTLDLSGINGVIVDKHSTGGVGDKTTLVLSPMLAACGVKVAKLSGRGLGFTGGTIDKVEAIPGFEVNLSADRFIDQVNRIGIALGSQTAELAPADGKIYALRDVTCTVASIPLIAASVVSKKIAAGAQVITLDIKVGDGAFMKTRDDAKALAFTCREVGKRLGRSISTVISYMGQPLGLAIGHTTEVIEALNTLRGEGPEDLTELCLVLGSAALFDAGLVGSQEEGKALLQRSLTNGTAIEKFRELIAAQGGDVRIIEEPERMPQPQSKLPVPSETGGYVQRCDALLVAQAAKILGAGRLKKGEAIDLAVGVVLNKKVGDAVEPGEALATLWANGKGVEEAEQLIREAFYISDHPCQKPSLVEEIHLTREEVYPRA